MPSPNNPVVKRNIISSVGCRMNNNIIVRKQDITPNGMENMEHNRIGAVASGLNKYPIPGKKPPAACRIAAIQAKIDPKMSFIVLLCLLNMI